MTESCTHERAHLGLDAAYCSDCQQTFSSGSKTYGQILKRASSSGSGTPEDTESDVADNTQSSRGLKVDVRPQTHSHQFIPVWQSDCTLVSRCKCGEKRECTLQELREAQRSCINLRAEYLLERDKRNSKAKQQEFTRAIAVKDRQIVWLEHQIKERAGETSSGLPPESHSFESSTSTPITPIQIDSELRALIPPLSSEERSQLEANLLAEGCRDPLVVWKGHNILLDGHNRYEICTTHGIEFNTVEIDLPDRNAAHDWLINNQLGRRNLTPEAVSYLRGKRYNLEKTSGHGTKSAGQNGTQIETAERLASDYKVGTRTIKRDAQFADAVDALAETLGEEVRQDLLGRNARLTKKDILNVAKVAAVDSEKAKSILNGLKSKSKSEDVLTVAHHLKLNEGGLVEINAPENNKINGRRGRIASVRERTVEVWLRDVDTMTMHKHTLKHEQVEPLPLEQEPHLKLLCDRHALLRKCSLDPFEVEILNLLERTIVLTPLENEYLANIEKRHGITPVEQSW